MASAKYLLVGSTEAYSGKSATVLGLAHQLLEKGLDIAYGKPLGTFWSAADRIDEDVRFLAETLKLPDRCLCPTLASLDAESIARRISGEDAIDYAARLRNSVQTPAGDLVLLEAAGTLEEGRLFNLSLAEVAEAIDASVVLVARCHSLQVADSLLGAKQCLGDRLVGVLLNDIPPDQHEKMVSQLQPFLERQGIPVLALLPRNSLLRSVSVGELVKQLQADVLCRPDRLDLMVESLTIGAMNVNSALKYFRKAHNMAVVTGGDRADLQLAALETSTQCLILTGHIPPMATILTRAEDLEIPILSVDLDTLTTVEIVDRAFGQVRLHEPIKVHSVYQMMEKHLDVDRLMRQLGLEPAVRA